MPYLGEPFDPTHPRCRYPAEGARFSELMEAANMRPPEIARATGIAVETIRGYRRGFDKPSTITRRKLEQVLGHSLDPVPIEHAQASVTVPATVTIQRNPSGTVSLTLNIDASQFSRLVA